MPLPALTPPPAPPRLPIMERAQALLRRLVPAPVTAAVAKIGLARGLWIGAGAVLAVFFLLMLWPRAQDVETAIIDRGVVRQEIIDQGRTRIHDVFVIAAPVAGRLERIELQPGDPVTRGAVIATIAPADPALLDTRVAAELEANVSAAQSGLSAAQAQLDLARRDQDRVARLAAQGFASQAALDSANAALNAARANVSARRADYDRARAAIDGNDGRVRAATPVRAPAAGRVLQLLQQSEMVVAPGTPLIEVGDPRDLEIVAEFLSQDAALMRAGAPAAIENWGGAPLAAHVARIEPYAHTKISALGVEEQRVNVILRLDHPDTAPVLGHGFRVDARVVTSEVQNALRAPTDALVRNGTGWAVYRLVNGRARLTPVEIGEGGDHYRAIKGGLGVGDVVILYPGDTLEDGARVRSAARGHG